MKILMVCLGNICRSPMAEGILRQKVENAGLPWTVESAGTTNGHQMGAAPHQLSQKVALLHGIDISQQTARPFRADDFYRFDKIYAMAKDVITDIKWIAKNQFDEGKVDLLMNEIFPGENLDIPDPWYGPERGYQEVFNMMEDACGAIISRYGNSFSERPVPEDLQDYETGDHHKP